MVQVLVNKPVTVNASTISVFVKVNGRGQYILRDDNGNILRDETGYVPYFFPGDDSEYLELDININTGEIVNWKIPNSDLLERFIEKGY